MRATVKQRDDSASARIPRSDRESCGQTAYGRPSGPKDGTGAVR